METYIVIESNGIYINCAAANVQLSESEVAFTTTDAPELFAAAVSGDIKCLHRCTAEIYYVEVNIEHFIEIRNVK